MKLAYFLLLFLLPELSSAQFLQDVSGKPYLQNPSNEYEGSPLLFQAWVRASVVTSDGKAYRDMQVNVDLFQDVPIFISEGKIYTFTQTINEFTISDSSSKMHFKRGHAIHPSLPNSFLQIMSDSPLILKQYNCDLVEVPTYGSSNKSYRYTNGKAFFVFIDNEYKKIALNKENARKAFASKWKAVEAYAKENDLSFKTEDGWKQLISFYKTAS